MSSNYPEIYKHILSLQEFSALSISGTSLKNNIEKINSNLFKWVCNFKIKHLKKDDYKNTDNDKLITYFYHLNYKSLKYPINGDESVYYYNDKYEDIDELDPTDDYDHNKEEIEIISKNNELTELFAKMFKDLLISQTEIEYNKNILNTFINKIYYEVKDKKMLMCFLINILQLNIPREWRIKLIKLFGDVEEFEKIIEYGFMINNHIYIWFNSITKEDLGEEWKEFIENTKDLFETKDFIFLNQYTIMNSELYEYLNNAIGCFDNDIIKKLLNNNKTVNFPYDYFIKYCLINRNYEALELILNEEIDINFDIIEYIKTCEEFELLKNILIKNDIFDDSLVYCCNKDLIPYLIKNGAQKEFIILNSNPNIIEYAIRNNFFDVNKIYNFDGNRTLPLINSINIENYELMLSLLFSGAHPDFTDQKRLSASSLIKDKILDINDIYSIINDLFIIFRID